MEGQFELVEELMVHKCERNDTTVSTVFILQDLINERN